MDVILSEDNSFCDCVSFFAIQIGWELDGDMIKEERDHLFTFCVISVALIYSFRIEGCNIWRLNI